jgi:hypothetical protein
MRADFTLRGGQLSMGLESGRGTAEFSDSDGNDPHEMSQEAFDHKFANRQNMAQSDDCGEFLNSIVGQFIDPLSAGVGATSSRWKSENWSPVSSFEWEITLRFRRRTIRRVEPQFQEMCTRRLIYGRPFGFLLIYLCERRVARRQTRDGWTFSDGLICK